MSRDDEGDFTDSPIETDADFLAGRQPHPDSDRYLEDDAMTRTTAQQTGTRRSAAKALAAAIIPLVLGVFAWIDTGLLNAPELVSFGGAAANAGLVYFVPNVKWLNTAKALIAGLVPLIIAILVDAPLSEIQTLAIPVLSLLLTYQTSNDPEPEGLSTAPVGRR